MMMMMMMMMDDIENTIHFNAENKFLLGFRSLGVSLRLISSLFVFFLVVDGSSQQPIATLLGDPGKGGREREGKRMICAGELTQLGDTCSKENEIGSWEWMIRAHVR